LGKRVLRKLENRESSGEDEIVKRSAGSGGEARWKCATDEVHARKGTGPKKELGMLSTETRVLVGLEKESMRHGFIDGEVRHNNVGGTDHGSKKRKGSSNDLDFEF
jgi:hypothetical protein